MRRPSPAAPRVLFATLSTLALLTGCGGAETRKANHMEKGQSFLSAGNYEKARVEFRNALQIAPDDAEARFQNGRVDEKLGNIREAAQYYQSAIEVDADHRAARANLGRLYLFSGAAERAMETIKPSLDKHPDDVALLTVRAAARARLKDVAGAFQDAEKAVQLAPGDEDAVAVLAGLYNSNARSDKARTLLESAVAKNAGSVDLRLALAQLLLSLKEDQPAEKLLLEVIALKPGEKSHRIRLAQYYARIGRNDDAEKVLRAGVQSLPEERELKVALVEFLNTRRSREAAEREFLAMTKARPEDRELQFDLARFHEQGGEPAKAQAVYESVIATENDAAAGLTARNRLATLAMQRGDFAQASRLIGEVLETNPRDNDALILRGNIALAKNDPQGAIADLRAVLRDQPNAVGVMRVLARAHLANGEPALAEETMRRAVEGNPGDVPVRLDLAQLLGQLGKPQQAAPILAELAKEQPNNLAVIDLQFRTAVAMQDIGAARLAADTLVVVEPKRSVGYLYQGMVAEAERRPDAAVALFRKALELQPDAAEPLQSAVRVLATNKRADEALRLLDDTATRFPKNALAPSLKGEILLSQKRFPEAWTALEMAVARAPAWWVPYRNLAYVAVARGDVAGATTLLQNAVAKVQEPEPLRGELASLFIAAGKVDEAMQQYEASLRANPSSPQAANNLAMLLVTYRKDAASLARAAELTRAFADSPNPQFLNTYGWVKFKQGEVAAALPALEKAVAQLPNAPTLRYHLGMAQHRAGQTASARENLALAVKNGAKFEGRQEAQTVLAELQKQSS